MNSDCLFCKISNKKEDSDLVYEDEEFVAFHDIAPQAPVHILVVPRKHIANVNSIKKEDLESMGRVFEVIRKLVGTLGIEKAYQLKINNGAGAGQVIDHLHIHLLGGWKSINKNKLNIG